MSFILDVEFRGFGMVVADPDGKTGSGQNPGPAVHILMPATSGEMEHEPLLYVPTIPLKDGDGHVAQSDNGQRSHIKGLAIDIPGDPNDRASIELPSTIVNLSDIVYQRVPLDLVRGTPSDKLSARLTVRQAELIRTSCMASWKFDRIGIVTMARDVVLRVNMSGDQLNVSAYATGTSTDHLPGATPANGYRRLLVTHYPTVRHHRRHSPPGLAEHFKAYYALLAAKGPTPDLWGAGDGLCPDQKRGVDPYTCMTSGGTLGG